MYYPVVGYRVHPVVAMTITHSGRTHFSRHCQVKLFLGPTDSKSGECGHGTWRSAR